MTSAHDRRGPMLGSPPLTHRGPLLTQTARGRDEDGPWRAWGICRRQRQWLRRSKRGQRTCEDPLRVVKDVATRSPVLVTDQPCPRVEEYGPVDTAAVSVRVVREEDEVILSCPVRKLNRGPGSGPTVRLM